MSTKKTHIYLLPSYANLENLEENRYERLHESKIKFQQEGRKLEISEVNSLVEERYCLSIMSAKYILEGMMSKNEIKEAMIHHHPFGHPWKHLQFKLTSKNEVIRINLEPVDEDDYLKCIKGFLHISQELIMLEQQGVKEDLISYFFNDKINELLPFKIYLLNKIKSAYKDGKILDASDKSLSSKQLESLRSEIMLLPFLDW
ncbi:hypothetical protein HYU06_04815 [Candidatus Woesearchaeota archaeon]|nr:hypothetical protein [Candidatus Woesearchaeota archaeon]